MKGTTRTYHVEVPEVWYQTVEIEAESPVHAIERVKDGDGDYLDDRLTYSHTLEGGEFKVEPAEANPNERAQ